MLAFRSPDGPAGARIELVTVQGRQVAVLTETLGTLKSALNQDGTISPVQLLMLAAPHAPGMYALFQYIQIRGAAPALLEGFLGYTDEVGPQSIPFLSQGLNAVQVVQPPALSFISNGLAAVTIDLSFGGAVGPPLLLDYFASLTQTA